MRKLFPICCEGTRKRWSAGGRSDFVSFHSWSIINTCFKYRWLFHWFGWELINTMSGVFWHNLTKTKLRHFYVLAFVHIFPAFIISKFVRYDLLISTARHGNTQFSISIINGTCGNTGHKNTLYMMKKHTLWFELGFVFWLRLTYSLFISRFVWNLPKKLLFALIKLKTNN